MTEVKAWRLVVRHPFRPSWHAGSYAYLSRPDANLTADLLRQWGFQVFLAPTTTWLTEHGVNMRLEPEYR